MPRPRKEPRQARSKHTVETILEATARVFAEHGYAGTNTSLIADKAGLEFPFFDAPRSESEPDRGIFQRVRKRLDDWRAAITPQDLDLATWVMLHIIESMVHAAVIDPPRFAINAIESAIVDAVMGYLTLGKPGAGAGAA
ncbi:TetR family transcriptional regulator [Massilia violaceinigra]|uniref:TetR family transcriptional regulator n=1 Tax=Massilia violaceinigra TaxID=2045208 RepID=A0ABY4AI25_9BURK|nr:TetR family transcriptional regulator [Massilia violaceinigra]